MAVSPPTNEAFLREVDEELRRDQALTLWRRYGRLGIALVLVALAGFAAFLGWQEWRRSQAEAQALEFNAVYDKLRVASGTGAEQELAELVKNGTPGYRANALLIQAGVALQKNDFAKAAQLFGQVATDPAIPEPLRKLALIRQTSAEYDRVSPEVVIARLKPLTAKGSPWIGSAGELVAAAYLRLGRQREAGRLFAAIAEDKNTPASLRQRTVQMAGALGVDAIDQSAARDAAPEGNQGKAQ
ncbi:MAG: hypothetical protein A4S12_06620 [Proteobacteria bacterium SG_bin5]|nr:tetratricopeptide repeat protein [Sphingomonas sp.]OQW42658.1 MAG: hypothetical protein A4S12_06620 [Proteobacteria bacterium SG_bin5]